MSQFRVNFDDPTAMVEKIAQLETRVLEACDKFSDIDRFRETLKIHETQIKHVEINIKSVVKAKQKEYTDVLD